MEELAPAALEASGAAVADALRDALDSAANAAEGLTDSSTSPGGNERGPVRGLPDCADHSNHPSSAPPTRPRGTVLRRLGNLIATRLRAEGWPDTAAPEAASCARPHRGRTATRPRSGQRSHLVHAERPCSPYSQATRAEHQPRTMRSGYSSIRPRHALARRRDDSVADVISMIGGVAENDANGRGAPLAECAARACSASHLFRPPGKHRTMLLRLSRSNGWLPFDGLSMCRCWVDDVGDALGEVVGGGSAESDGDDDGAVGVSEPDEPRPARMAVPVSWPSRGRPRRSAGSQRAGW